MALGLRGDPAQFSLTATRLQDSNICVAANEFAERGLTFHLHAYQCHVLMDWHEKWATAEKPWDRLCDQLNGRGVPQS